MGVVHVSITGTKEEVDTIRRSLTKYSSDRRLRYTQIYTCMSRYLGVEIWDVTVSKLKLDKASAAALRRINDLYPKVIWRATDAHDRVLSDSNGLLTNYDPTERDYPGPYGQLCKKYGKSYSHAFDPIDDVELRLPHMLPSTPLNQGGIGTASQRDKITAARRQLAPNGRVRVAVLQCGDTVGKQYLLQHCMRAMENEGWSQTEIDAFFIAVAGVDYQQQLDRYVFFLNYDGTLYEK